MEIMKFFAGLFYFFAFLIFLILRLFLQKSFLGFSVFGSRGHSISF